MAAVVEVAPKDLVAATQANAKMCLVALPIVLERVVVLTDVVALAADAHPATTAREMVSA